MNPWFDYLWHGSRNLESSLFDFFYQFRLFSFPVVFLLSFPRNDITLEFGCLWRRRFWNEEVWVLWAIVLTFRRSFCWGRLITVVELMLDRFILVGAKRLYSLVRLMPRHNHSIIVRTSTVILLLPEGTLPLLFSSFAS
jgi:hypothetical protein